MHHAHAHTPGAQFEREQNIGDEDVLVEAAKAAGLDPQAARDYLRSGDGSKTVETEVKEFMTKYRVSGVPFFIVQMLEDSVSDSSGKTAETQQIKAAEGAGGVVCGEDGVCERPAPQAAASSSADVASTTAANPERKALTSRYTASGAQEVEYFVQLFEHLEEEASRAK